MKKKIVLIIDILTVILLFIQVQSTIVFVEERFLRLNNYLWNDYFYYYAFYGISSIIIRSSYEKLYIGVVFIVFCLNLYAIVLKFVKMYEKEMISGWHKWIIVINVIFVSAKIMELFGFYSEAMSI